MNDANFVFFVIYIHEKALKLDYLFCIVLVCSEPQQVFKYTVHKVRDIRILKIITFTKRMS